MKKLLSVLLAAAMLVGMLAGCSGQSSSTPAQQPADASQPAAPAEGGDELTGTLTLWTHQNPGWEPAYQADIDKFTALHPGVTIEMESFPYTDFQSKLQTSLVSGEGADLYVIFGSWAAQYMPTGALSKVPDELAARMDSDFFPSAKGGFTYDGAYYGLPLEYNIEYGGMLVNKHLFGDTPYPTTWEELEKLSDEVSVRNGELMDMRGFDFVGYDGLTNMLLALILSEGGQYLEEDGKTVNLSTPEAAAAMMKMVEWIRDREWTNMDGITNYTEGGYNALFKDNAYMTMAGPWVVSTGEENYGLTYGVDFDYVALPQPGKENKFAAETGWGIVVPEKSPQKDLAWEFLSFLAEPENLMAHNIACAQLPPCKSIADDPAYAEAMPYAAPILDMLGDGQYMGSFNTDVFKQAVNGAFIELVRDTGKYSGVEEALADIESTINAQSAKE